MENHNSMNVNTHKPKGGTIGLEHFSYLLLLLLVFLLPIFFIPSISFPFQASKIFLISFVSLISFTFWVISRLRAGNISLPTGYVAYSTLAILVFGLLSTLLSGVVKESFIGLGSETSTYLFFLSLFLLALTFSRVVNTSLKVLIFFKVFIFSLALLALFQILRLYFGAEFLSFGVLNDITSTTVGRWNDLSIIFGFSALGTVLWLSISENSKTKQLLLYTWLLLSLFFMAIVNYFLGWVFLALSLLVFVVRSYFMSRSKREQDIAVNASRGISKLGIAVFVVATLFVLFNSQVGNFMSKNLGITQIEARPSFSSTFLVSKDSLERSPGFGAGPNRFSIEWGKSKPIPVNNTIFWETPFNYGIGVIPTMLVTNGALGFVSWLIFLGSLFVVGFKSLFITGTNDKLGLVRLVSFFGTLYLWTFMIFAVPGPVSMVLTFVVTGVFLMTMTKENLIKEKEIEFSDDSKQSFVLVFVLILIIMVNIALIYGVTTRYVSLIYSQKASNVVNNSNDLESGERYLKRAISLAKTDSNYRLMSQIQLGKLSLLLSDQSLADTEEGRVKFQEILGSAISRAQSATTEDVGDYRNWLALGNIYESIIPLQIQGAYENAKLSYEKALEVNPTNPSVDLALARIEVLTENSDSARIHISNSLQKKNNYTAAIFLLSQLEINEGNIAEAIKAVESASLISPNDPLTFFQLGYLKYSQNDNTGAIVALERAVGLNPTYSNAKYFLGLSYYNAGRVDDAIIQFEDIQKLNPDNAEIKKILENLSVGDNPLSGIVNSGAKETGELPLQES